MVGGWCVERHTSPPPTEATDDVPSLQPPTGTQRSRESWAPVAAIVAAAVLLLGTALLAVEVVSLRADEHRLQRSLAVAQAGLRADGVAVNGVSGRLATVEGRVSTQPDTAKLAALVRPSVVTIKAGDELGSGFAFDSTGGHAGIITNYHVIARIYENGARTVEITRDNAAAIEGTIEKVDKTDDLALVRVTESLPVLHRSTATAAAGDPVLVVGSPLGLGDSVSTGVVSNTSSGVVQFTAPISPGNSGGPVVDRTGAVLGVARSKLIGGGAEGLGLAIPVATVCGTVASC